MAKAKLPKCDYLPFDLMEFNGQPTMNLPGDSWSILSKWNAPSAKQTQDQLINLRARLHWSRPRLGAFLGVAAETIRRWEDGHRKPRGAASRLIWLMETLAFHPEKLKDGLDFIFWGQREEIEAFGKKFGIIDPSPLSEPGCASVT